MIRRIEKDTELASINISGINEMSDGDSFEVYVVAPIQNGYFLGFQNSSATSETNGTNIYSELKEKAYIESKIETRQDIIWNVEKNNGSLYLTRDETMPIKELPTLSVNKVIMLNGSRYLGVNGTSVTSTNSHETAVSDVKYHWEMVYDNSGRFKLYNPNSKRYIRYTNSRFSINTASTSLYVSYTNNSFTIKGTTSSTYLYMSSNTAISSNTRTQYWTIYSLKVSPSSSGRTSGVAPIWSYPKPLKFTQSTPTSGTNLLAGYKSNELLKIGHSSGNTTMYLNHKAALSNLQFTTGGTSTETSWVFLNKNASSRPEPPRPINPQIDTEWMEGKSGGDYTWDYTTGDFEMTYTGPNQKLLFWMHDETTIGTKAYWADLTIYENGVLMTDHSKYVSVGFYCNNPKYSITEGCSPYHQANTDINGVRHNSTIEFNTSSTITESINWPLKIKIVGLTFE